MPESRLSNSLYKIAIGHMPHPLEWLLSRKRQKWFSYVPAVCYGQCTEPPVLSHALTQTAAATQDRKLANGF